MISIWVYFTPQQLFAFGRILFSWALSYFGIVKLLLLSLWLIPFCIFHSLLIWVWALWYAKTIHTCEDITELHCSVIIFSLKIFSELHWRVLKGQNSTVCRLSLYIYIYIYIYIWKFKCVNRWESSNELRNKTCSQEILL